MNTTAYDSMPTASAGSTLITYDPDFALPDRSLQPRLPLWVVATVALSTVCAAALVARLP